MFFRWLKYYSNLFERLSNDDFRINHKALLQKRPALKLQRLQTVNTK